jgi:hypothetical protein
LIAKSRQTKLSYGTPGVGSQLHLAMELFKQKTGVEITHVPYRGTPPALTDLLETPDAFADRIRRETAIWRDLIRQRNITAN